MLGKVSPEDAPFEGFVEDEEETCTEKQLTEEAKAMVKKARRQLAKVVPKGKKVQAIALTNDHNATVPAEKE